MCGLVGIVGPIGKDEEAMFKDLLTFDVVRGPHSTGVVAAYPDKAYGWAKQSVLPSDFFQLRMYRDAVKVGNQPCLLMGHNRYATVGGVNHVNAHPFEHENVVGMHNGTLLAWHRSLAKANDFTVDSDCLLYNISEFGAEDTLPDVDGAFALTWYDKENHTFSCIRNKERPLYWAILETGQLIYASEPWMISAVSWRHNRKLEDQPMLFPENKMYTFKLPGKKHKNFQKPEEKHIPPYVPPKYNYASRDLPKTGDVVRFTFIEYVPGPQGTRGYMEGLTLGLKEHVTRVYCTEQEAQAYESVSEYEFKGKVASVIYGYNGNGQNTEDALILNPKTVDYVIDDKGNKEETKGEVIPFRPQHIGPDGEFITEAEWDKLTDKGCSHCSTNLFYGDKVTWCSDGTVLCQDCAEEFSLAASTRKH